jgi:CO/xanthine dehydrogenase Mo-binding subunit/CO/xanthine dehydrogenase FAD-binding subunit
MNDADRAERPRTHIGRRAWPIDWDTRSAGGASYVGDIVPPNALVGAVLRSPYSYALIEEIDVSRVARMPGVHAVITAKNFPAGALLGVDYNFDRPPLADDAVRFVGQEVAAVAAETKAQAQAAAAAIRVRYRPLRAPLKIDDALAADALKLHEPSQTPGGHGHGSSSNGASAEGAAQKTPPAPSPQKNVRDAFRRVWGDAEAGRSKATVSVSGRFWFSQHTQCCLETHGTLADWRDGRLHIWASTATPLVVKFQLAMLFKLDPSQVVVHEVAVGGSFGAKLQITDDEALAAMLSQVSKRPVVIVLTREEEFEASPTRHGFDMHFTLYADDSGHLRAVDGKMRVDNGAYLHQGPSVMSASMLSFGSYKVDGIDIEAQLIDTCKAPGGAVRGYGGPQTTFAIESLMDDLALRLGRDPIDLRIQNAHGSHTTTLLGHVGTNGTVNCLKAGREAIGWEKEKAHPRHGRGRGVGVAIGEHCSGAYVFPDANRCDGVIDLYTDGRLRVRFGGSDVGTGQKTILAQIAAQELGVPWERISVLSMDTDETPLDFGGWASRGTHHTGHAISLTARKFAEQLKSLAADRLGGGEIRLEDGFARSERGEVPLGELVAMSNETKDGMLTHSESFVDANVEMIREGRGNFSPTHNYAAHAAIVEVDEKTGKIRVVDYVSASDAGTVINPILMEGQIAGAVVMGLGGVLAEELLFEQGKVVNPAFLDYAVPRAADVPAIRMLHEGLPDENGPYGAKGVGELGVNPAAPTIANAVFDAIGLRLSSMPLTPDKVINALAAKQGRRRNFHLWRRPGRWYFALVRWMYRYGLFQLLHRWQTRNLQAAPPAPPAKSVESPSEVAELVQGLGQDAAILGGGTDLALRRRQNITAPPRLVAAERVAGMKQLSVPAAGPIIVGAAVTLSDLANAVRTRIPALAEAIDEIASPQIRNVATVAGNLAQANRCWFFRNGFNCYKRKGRDAPCYAVLGDHRFYHAAIDGHRCQAVTPSDLATVLVALDATATITGPSGTRELKIENLYAGPGELCLGDQEVLVRVAIPAEAADRRSAFRKLNLWQGDFAIASAAVSVGLDAAGCCTDVRICLGAIAPVPFRARATERRLIGQKLTVETLRAYLDQELNDRGHPLERNGWKLDAVAGLAERALEEIMEVPAGRQRPAAVDALCIATEISCGA